MRYLLLGFLVATWLLTACDPLMTSVVRVTSHSGGAAPTPVAGRPTTTGRPSSPTSGQQEPASEPVIVYTRSGGIAGVDERWTIYPAGRIVAKDGGVRQVPSEQVTALLDEVEAAGFWKMENSYGEGSPCRDCFSVDLTVREDDMLKEVSAVLEASDTPDTLREVVGKVDKLVRNR